MIVSKSDTENILAWCLSKDNRDKYMLEKPYHNGGDPVGIMHLEKGHDSFPVGDLLYLSDIFLQHYGLPEDTQIDSFLGFLASYSEKGHEVHRHRDANLSDTVHTRINVLISKPERGGNPVINRKEIVVQENETWLCVAGEHWHSTTKVEGSKPRIILSLGYHIPKKTVELKGWI